MRWMTKVPRTLEKRQILTVTLPVYGEGLGRKKRQVLLETYKAALEAAGQLMKKVEDGLVVQTNEAGGITTAFLSFFVNAHQAARLQILLNREDQKNTFRVVAVEPEGDKFRVTCRIAERRARKPEGEETVLSTLNAKMVLQSLLQSYLGPEFLWALNGPLRSGVAQDVAQALNSHLVLVDTGAGRTEVSFPRFGVDKTFSLLFPRSDDVWFLKGIKPKTRQARYFAALPLELPADSSQEAKPVPFDALRSGLIPASIMGCGAIPQWRYQRLLLPVEDCLLLEVLERTDVKRAWVRVVRTNAQFFQKRRARGRTKETRRRQRRGEEWQGDWAIQLVIHAPCEPQIQVQNVMGVSFFPPHEVNWVVLNKSGEDVAKGTVPNTHFSEYLKTRANLDSQQEHGRKMAGWSSHQILDEQNHLTANAIVEIARKHSALVAREQIRFVKKRGPDPAANVAATGRNFGRLAFIIDYQSRLAGLGKPLEIWDIKTLDQCPNCGACRQKGQDKKTADTWRLSETVLSCRKCGFQGSILPEERARRAAVAGLEWLQRKIKKKEESA